MWSWVGSIPKRIEKAYAASFDRNGIAFWQSYIFHLVAISGACFGALCFLPAAPLILHRSGPAALLLVGLIYALDVLVIFLRRPSVRAKTLLIAGNFYLYGLISLAIAGAQAESGIWFVGGVLMASMFAGLGPALALALLALATGLGLGLLQTLGLITWGAAGDFSALGWILQSMTIFLVNMMLLTVNVILVRGVGSTFAALKEAEAQVRTALGEKETLLRELYHRTKNNMQVVSSLLLLHSRDIEAEGAKAVFRDITSKIAAMSLVHQKLYESKDLSNVGLREYIGELAALLAASYGAAPERVRFRLDIEDARMPVDTAVPCGLVISEIVSNALKHAFPGGREGEIAIALRCSGEFVVLTIADDGVGLPEGFRRESQGRMGMKTLYTMVEHQLRGGIELSAGRGLRYEIRFRRDPRDERAVAHG